MSSKHPDRNGLQRGDGKHLRRPVSDGLPPGALAPRSIGGKLIFGLFKGILGLFTRALTSSWAYKEGVALARNHAVVRRILGDPIEAGTLAQGQIHKVNDGGHARLAIPLRGTHHRGTLHVVATRNAGVWSLDRAEVVSDAAGERIDLLEGSRQLDDRRTDDRRFPVIDV